VKSQGWTPLILEHTKQRQADEYVEPDQRIEPDKGQAVVAALYSVGLTRSMLRLGESWSSRYVVRVNPGAVRHTPHSPKSYEPPLPAMGRWWRTHRNGRVLGVAATAILPASIAAVQKARSMGRTPLANIARRLDALSAAGPQFKDCRTTAGAESTTTLGRLVDTLGWGETTACPR